MQVVRSLTVLCVVSLAAAQLPPPPWVAANAARQQDAERQRAPQKAVAAERPEPAAAPPNSPGAPAETTPPQTDAQLVNSNPAAHVLNERVLQTLSSSQNEVVCVLCLLQVMAAAHRLGNSVVRQQVEDALQSPQMDRLGDVLHAAVEAEPTLAGELVGYYKAGVFDGCDKSKPTRRGVTAAASQRRRERCERINTFVHGRGSAVDFADQTTTSRINSQVARATRGEITNLFDRLAADTQLVFASTLVFGDKWESRFVSQRGIFHTVHGPVRTRMMFRREYFPIIDGADDGIIGVSLPYINQAIRLFLFTTTSYSAHILDDLQHNHYRQLADARFVYTNATLPRFDVSSKKRSYIDMLQQLDMGEMLQGGLGANDVLKVDRLVHKAVMATDEHGTRAAGAAGFALVPLSAKPKPFMALFDRPFVASLYHMQLGVPLFTAFVADPRIK